jgi:hypothetical protein
MRPLVALVHQLFDGSIGVRLVKQELVDVRNRDIRLHVPEDLEAGLNRELRLGREEWILTAASGQRYRRIDNDLGVRGSGNIRVARDIDRVARPPQLIFS